MSYEKRPISICACGAPKTRQGTQWICDRAGTDCDGDSLSVTQTLSAEELKKIRKDEAMKKPAATPAVLAASVFINPINPTERVADRLGLGTPG